MEVVIRDDRNIPKQSIIALYKANNWSAADKPDLLYQALLNSHSLISAWWQEELVGLANAISDGYLVVYFPHMLVHPLHQGKGIGQKIMLEMEKHYGGFHMQMLVADGRAIDFYHKMGFEKAGDTQAMWKYKGLEH